MGSHWLDNGFKKSTLQEEVDTSTFFTYNGKDYRAWSSFDSHFKPADSQIGKFNRYAKLGRIADKVVSKFRNTLETDPLSQEGRLSYACLLMLLSGIRVGNEDSAEGYESGLPGNLGEIVNTYGVTTLLPEHVEIIDDKMELNFLGKKQVEQSISVEDPTLVKIGQLYLENPQGDTWIGIDLNSLTSFIRSNVGENFTPKDMRAFFANTYCYDLMRNQTWDKQSIKTIIEKVASKLGNTPAVTKRNYLDSRMLDWFLSNGELSLKESSYPAHPDTLIIPANEWYPDGLKEKDIWEYYDSVKQRIVSELADSPVLIVTSIDGGLIRRNDPNTGEPLRINSVEDFEVSNNGRNSEFHTVVGDTTSTIWVDLDPKEEYPFEAVRMVAMAVAETMRKIKEIEEVKIRFSGGRGFHIIGLLAQPLNTNELRKRLLSLLNGEIVSEFENVTTDFTDDPKFMRLDVSTLHPAGSIRAEWSLNSKTGLVCAQPDILQKEMSDAEKSDFKIENILLNVKTASISIHVGKWLRTAAKVEIPARFNEVINKLLLVAKKHGFIIYAVGGFVRDLMIGREPKDLDICVEVDQGGIKFAEMVAQELGLHKPVIFPTFGTAMLKVDNEDIEFVMLRAEHYSPESRKPEVSPGTLQEDAMRRDFGTNALFLRLNDMELLDPTGHGLEDIQNRVIRVTDMENADIIFSEDPLRMLRAIRQSLQLGFSIDPDTIEAIKRNASRISVVSYERIRDELSKILTIEKNPSRGFRFLEETGLLELVIPELSKTRGVTQPEKWHDKDVLDHILAVLDATFNKLTLRLAALLHDIGKPETRRVVKDVTDEAIENIHFYGHEDVGEKMAEEILRRLKFPNDIVDTVSTLVGAHMRPHGTKKWKDSTVREFIREMGDNLADLLDLVEADYAGSKEGKDGHSTEDLQHMRDRIERLQTQVDITKIPRVLTGDDIMELFDGVTPGPWIGRIMKFLEEQQNENPNLTEEEGKELAKKFVSDNPELIKKESMLSGFIDVLSSYGRKAIRLFAKAEFKFDPNSTENEGRWRLRDPKDFVQDSYSRWSTWAGVKAPAGISFLVGNLTSGKKALQAIRFDKGTYTEPAAAQFWNAIRNKPGFEKVWAPADWEKWKAVHLDFRKEKNLSSPIKNPSGTEFSKKKDHEEPRNVNTLETPRETHMFDQESTSTHPDPGKQPSLNIGDYPLSRAYKPYDSSYSVDVHANVKKKSKWLEF